MAHVSRSNRSLQGHADIQGFCKRQPVQITLVLMQQSNDIVTLSIVVPVYSGEKYLADLVAEIADLKRRWDYAAIHAVHPLWCMGVLSAVPVRPYYRRPYYRG